MIQGTKIVTGIIRKGVAFFFLLLFLNISFSPVYKVVLKVQLMDILSITAEEENHSENCKKLSELDKEFFSYSSFFSFGHSPLNDNLYFHQENNIIIFHPEKASPPPKGFTIYS